MPEVIFELKPWLYQILNMAQISKSSSIFDIFVSGLTMHRETDDELLQISKHSIPEVLERFVNSHCA